MVSRSARVGGSLVKGVSSVGTAGELLLVPLIRVAGDVAKMLGYPAGLRWRRQNRARDEIYWRRGIASGRRYG